MTEYVETITINVNDKGVLTANSELERLRNTGRDVSRTQIKFEGVDVGRLREAETVMNAIRKSAKSNMELNIKEGNLNTVIKNLEKITTEITALKSIASNIPVKINDNGSIRKVTNDVNTLTKEINNIPSSKNINITGASGNGHTPNIYGFDADANATYQASSTLMSTSRNFVQMAEKFNVFGSNMMMLTSLMGIKSAKETLVDIPAKAEVNKYFAGNMQGSATGFSIYDTLDKATDELPISMQNVVQPLYGFKSATGATAEEINSVVPDFANFGAQVINMTGSEERAETAMLKLSYAISSGDDKGRWEAVDQYGINEKAVRGATDENGNKIWNPDKDEKGDVVGFMKAVTSVVGDAKESMNNYNGMTQIVSKDFARAGKTVWENFTGPVLTNSLRAYDTFDNTFGGLPSILLEVGGAGLSMASTLTQTLGSVGMVIANFGEIGGALRAMKDNGGGLLSTLKNIVIGSHRELHGISPDAGFYSSASNYTNKTVSNPHLTHIDSNVSRIANQTTANNLRGNMGDSSEDIRGMVREHRDNPLDSTHSLFSDETKNEFNKTREARKKIDSKYKKEMDYLNQYKETHPNFYAKEKAKLDKKHNSRMRKLTKGLSSLDENTSILKKGFLGLAGILTNPIFLGAVGALGLAGVGLAMKAVKDSSARNESVKKSLENLNTAWTTAQNSIMTGIGNWIGSTVYGHKIMGDDAVDKAILDIANNTAKVLNILSGNDIDSPNKTEQTDKERFGWKDTDTDAIREVKQESIEDATWWYNIRSGIAHGIDSVFGTDYKKGIREDYDEYVRDVQAGTFKKSYGAGGTAEADLGFNPIAQEKGYHNNKQAVFDKEFKMTGHDWGAKLFGSFDDAWTRYVKEKVYGLDFNTSDLVTERQLKNYGYDKKSPLEHTSEQLNNLISSITSFDYAGAIFSSVDKYGAKSLLQKYGIAEPESKTNFNLDDILSKLTMSTKSISQPVGKIAPSSVVRSDEISKAYQGVSDTSNVADNLISNIINGVTTKGGELSNTIMNTINTGLATADFSMVGNSVSTNINSAIQESFATTPIDLTGFFSNITSQLSMHSAEFNTAGNDGGNQYQTGFGNGIGGTSGIASAEAGEVLSALDISASAYSLGAAAGNAFQEGFKSSKGADIESPGKAARLARDESNYILGFMQGSISPIYNTARQMGSSMASGFARDGSLAYTGGGFSAVKKENTAGYIMSSGDSTKTYHLTQNVNIEKVDSKERAKEIAEYTVKMMKWNNETAGRTTEV